MGVPGDDDLPELDLADRDAPVERGADGLLRDGRPEVRDRRVGLLGARLGGVEVGLRVGLAPPQPLGALEADPRERRVGHGRGELRLLRGGVELHEHLRRASRRRPDSKRDLADRPGQLGAEDHAPHRDERPDRRPRGLPLRSPRPWRR